MGHLVSCVVVHEWVSTGMCSAIAQSIPSTLVSPERSAIARVVHHAAQLAATALSVSRPGLLLPEMVCSSDRTGLLEHRRELAALNERVEARGARAEATY